MGETVNVTILIDNSYSMSGNKDILNEEIVDYIKQKIKKYENKKSNICSRCNR